MPSNIESVIGGLLYLIVSRFDILFAVSMCIKFQSCSKKSHLTIVKRILNVGLWYPKTSSFDLVEFTDSNYVGCMLDMKNTSSSC